MHARAGGRLRLAGEQRGAWAEEKGGRDARGGAYLVVVDVVGNVLDDLVRRRADLSRAGESECQCQCVGGGGAGRLGRERARAAEAADEDAQSTRRDHQTRGEWHPWWQKRRACGGAKWERARGATTTGRARAGRGGTRCSGETRRRARRSSGRWHGRASAALTAKECRREGGGRAGGARKRGRRVTRRPRSGSFKSPVAPPLESTRVGSLPLTVALPRCVACYKACLPPLCPLLLQPDH